MMTLNDTISAFRCCTLVPPRCSKCPLTEMCKGSLSKDRCKTEVKLSVNHWLKAQEPRVMTLEEVKSACRNRNIAFLVECKDGGNPVWMLYYDYISMPGVLEEIVLIDKIANLRDFGVDVYGVDWRCWTSRPDEKRRAETPWN